MTRLRITEYTRPPVKHTLDPRRTNWLWKMIITVAGIEDDELVEALQAQGVKVTKNRLKGWRYAETNERFSALNLSELVRNLDALIKYDRRNAGGNEADEK